MPAILKGLSGIYAGCQIEVGSQPIVIGRDPAQAHLIIPETQAEVSGRHMSICFDSMRQVFLIIDTSTNGTFLMSGERMIQHQPCPLRSGMRFYLSNTNTSFEVEVTGSLPAVTVGSGQAPIGYPEQPAQQQVAYHMQPQNHAGFWMRVPAYLIDVVLLGIVVSIPLVLIFMSNRDEFNDRRLLISLVLDGLFWLYSALMESSKYQGTLGKVIIGIKVTDLSGRPISFGRATARFFTKILLWFVPSMVCLEVGWTIAGTYLNTLGGVILCIGWMMAGWTKRKQALHDMMAGCLVEKK